MPQILVLAARYIAIFGLVVAILLIFVRWRFPKKDITHTGDGGSSSEKDPSYWQVLWHLYKKAKARNQAREADQRELRGKRVLVVDPDEKSCKVLIWRLEQLGCKVTKARTGAQAIVLAGSVDVVISDALLPDVSAVDFCYELKDMPIVLVGVLKAQRDELSKFGKRIERLRKPYDPDDAAVLAGRLVKQRSKVGVLEG